jgi:protein arginine kinase activator
MQCDVCHQQNATIFLTQVVEGKVQKVNLCQGCAQSKGVTDSTGFNLAELLQGVGEETVQVSSSRGVACPTCGFSQSDFKKTGRLGCSECYQVFHDGLTGLLKAMHKGTRHTGKVPGQQPRQVSPRVDYSGQIEMLRKRLSASVEAENYEEAAMLRDELRQLEARMLDAGG